MTHAAVLGEFEHLVMLAILQLDNAASALDVRGLLEQKAERSVSRGALYATLDRLERKGYLDWETEDATPERGGIPKRLFRATASGLEAVQRSNRIIARLSEGLSLR